MFYGSYAARNERTMMDDNLSIGSLDGGDPGRRTEFEKIALMLQLSVAIMIMATADWLLGTYLVSLVAEGDNHAHPRACVFPRGA